MSLPEKESAPISKSGNPLAACSRIVILTGAGISAESGLPTFRGKDGLWEGRRFEEVATPEAFARDPDQVHRFYNHRRRQLANVAPNAAHRALAELECRRQGDLLVVTQNVDDLHERAGQRRLIHMHGQLDRARCLSCGWAGAWNGDLGSSDPCPGCARSSRLRPDIVWFGEVPTAMDQIEAALGACDLFVAVGTSGKVYPAAGFVDLVRSIGRAHTIEINLDASAADSRFREQRRGLASKEVPRLVAELSSAQA